MTRRTRSVLIDSTIGRIFTNVSSVTSAAPTSMIAGAKLTSRSIVQNKKATVTVSNNIGNTGLFFVGGALVTQIIMSVVKAPAGSSILIKVKVGATYATAVATGPEYALNQNTKSATHNVSITVPPGESLFVDITQRGALSPGAGLSLNFVHYAG